MPIYRPVSVRSHLGKDLGAGFVSSSRTSEAKAIYSLVSINNPKQVDRISIFDLLLIYSDFSARFLCFVVHVDRLKWGFPASTESVFDQFGLLRLALSSRVLPF